MTQRRRCRPAIASPVASDAHLDQCSTTENVIAASANNSALRPMSQKKMACGVELWLMKVGIPL